MNFAIDEDAFMQLLKAVMTENFDRLGDEFSLWLDENEPRVGGRSYEDGPEYVRESIRDMFVEDCAYENRADMMDMFGTELGLDRYDRVWSLMDEHVGDFTEEYGRWLEDNTGCNGIGYRKPSIGMLWCEFMTDYGIRHAEEILGRYEEGE